MVPPVAFLGRICGIATVRQPGGATPSMFRRAKVAQ